VISGTQVSRTGRFQSGLSGKFNKLKKAAGHSQYPSHKLLSHKRCHTLILLAWILTRSLLKWD